MSSKKLEVENRTRSIWDFGEVNGKRVQFGPTDDLHRDGEGVISPIQLLTENQVDKLLGDQTFSALVEKRKFTVSR